MPRESGSSQIINTYMHMHKPYWVRWDGYILSTFLCYDILTLGKSHKKIEAMQRQRPDMTFAVNWDVEHQIKKNQSIPSVSMSLLLIILIFSWNWQSTGIIRPQIYVYYVTVHYIISMVHIKGC